MYQNYNMNQESLEVQIPYTYTIRPDHIVRIISDFVDSLPLDMLLKNTPHTLVGELFTLQCCLK